MLPEMQGRTAPACRVAGGGAAGRWGCGCSAGLTQAIRPGPLASAGLGCSACTTAWGAVFPGHAQKGAGSPSAPGPELLLRLSSGCPGARGCRERARRWHPGAAGMGGCRTKAPAWGVSRQLPCALPAWDPAASLAWACAYRTDRAGRGERSAGQRERAPVLPWKGGGRAGPCLAEKLHRPCPCLCSQQGQVRPGGRGNRHLQREARKQPGASTPSGSCSRCPQEPGPASPTRGLVGAGPGSRWAQPLKGGSPSGPVLGLGGGWTADSKGWEPGAGVGCRQAGVTVGHVAAGPGSAWPGKGAGAGSTRRGSSNLL